MSTDSNGHVNGNGHANGHANGNGNGTNGRGHPESQRVLAGVLRHVRNAASDGAPLIGEVDLAERVGATRKQVRDALASLEQQGVVRRRQGAATIVDPVALRMSVRFEEQMEYAVLLRQLGYESTVDVLDVSPIELPDELATLLMTDRGRRAARVVKRWRADGRVAMLAFTTIPLPEGVELSPEVGASVYSAVAEIWGEPVVWEIATPSAEALSAADAALLELPVGTPVLSLDIIGISLSGRRLFRARELHDPSVVSYSVMRTVQPPQLFSTARYQF